MDLENNVQGTEQQLVEETQIEQQETPVQEEKSFTQDEVNNIIEKRLKRERERINSVLSDDQDRIKQLEDREKNLEKRELQAAMREKAKQDELSLLILDQLDYTDEEVCNKSYDELKEVVIECANIELRRRLRGGAPMKKAQDNMSDDEMIAGAFDLKK